jgi:hypothetical protein
LPFVVGDFCELELDELEGDELDPEAALELEEREPFIASSNSWRLTEPSWFLSTELKSSFDPAEAELPPLAEDLLFFFIAASHSERLSLPSWFVSALPKSSDWLAAAELEPPLDADGVLLAEEDCLLFEVSLAYAEPAASARTENATTQGLH